MLAELLCCCEWYCYDWRAKTWVGVDRCGHCTWYWCHRRTRSRL